MVEYNISLEGKTVLVTGAAGFIGSNLMQVLATRGVRVIGIDNLNDYYDIRLKYYRLTTLGFNSGTASLGE